MQKPSLSIILAQPRGFCAGVDRAITIVEKALEKHGAPIYVRHEIVHNRYVVDSLKAKGAIFVDELSDIPEGAVTVFSAHGVAESVESEAKNRHLPVIDATCPLVQKVHKEAQRHEAMGQTLILIGHKGHPEVEGTSGRVKNPVILVQSVEDVAEISVENEKNLAYVTQTTLSVDDTRNIINALKVRFPQIVGPELKDICYATQNRQDAVKKLAQTVDMLLVIGAKNSSNSNRLRILGEEIGLPSYLIDGADDIDFSWFQGVSTVGITAGASAPEILLTQILDRLEVSFSLNITTMKGIEENVKFKLPPELQEVA